MDINTYGLITSNIEGKNIIIGALNQGEEPDFFDITHIMEIKELQEDLTGKGCILQFVDIGIDLPMISADDVTMAKDSDGEDFTILDVTSAIDFLQSTGINVAEATCSEVNLSAETFEEIKSILAIFMEYIDKKITVKYCKDVIFVTSSAKSLFKQFEIDNNYTMKGVTSTSSVSSSSPMYIKLSDYNKILYDVNLAEERTGAPEYTEPDDFGAIPIVPEFYVPDLKGNIIAFPANCAKYGNTKEFVNCMASNSMKKEDKEIILGSYASIQEVFEPYENEAKFYDDLVGYIDYEISLIKQDADLTEVTGKDFIEYGVLYKYFRYTIFCVLRDNWGYTDSYAKFVTTAEDIADAVSKYKAFVKKSEDDDTKSYYDNPTYLMVLSILENCLNSETRYEKAAYDTKNEGALDITTQNNTLDTFIEEEVKNDIYFQAKVIITLLRSGQRRPRGLYLPSINSLYIIYSGELTSAVPISNLEVVPTNGMEYDIVREIYVRSEPLNPSASSYLKLDGNDNNLNSIFIGLECVKKYKSSISDRIITVPVFFSVFDIVEILDKEGTSIFNGIKYNQGEIEFEYLDDMVFVSDIIRYKDSDRNSTEPKLYISSSVNKVSAALNYGLNFTSSLAEIDQLFNAPAQDIKGSFGVLAMTNIKDASRATSNLTISKESVNTYYHLIKGLETYLTKYKELMVKANSDSRSSAKINEEALVLALSSYISDIKEQVDSLTTSKSGVNKLKMSKSFESKINAEPQAKGKLKATDMVSTDYPNEPFAGGSIHETEFYFRLYREANEMFISLNPAFTNGSKSKVLFEKVKPRFELAASSHNDGSSMKVYFDNINTIKAFVTKVKSYASKK